jgi:apolipoprotein N-acyltransferase
MAALHWLRLPHPATIIGWIVLAGYFAFYLPLFVGLSRVAVHRLRVPVILAAPIVWTGLELARAHVLTGMTMGSLGHTQYRWVELIQIGDLAGAFGVAFVMMLVSASLARMVPWDGQRWAFWPLLPAAAVVGATLFYGHCRMIGDAGEPGPRVALVQGSIDVTMQYDPNFRDRAYREYFGLSHEAVERNTNLDLIVWPEAMFQYSLVTHDENPKTPEEYPGTEVEFRQFLKDMQRNRELLAKTARSLGTPMLVGVDIFHYGKDEDHCCNSAALMSIDGQLLGHYGKMHLVMFGEYVPFGREFPWLQRLTPLPYSVLPGERPESFALAWTDPRTHRKKTCRIAPNICYETVLSHVIRGQIHRLTAEGTEPDILVNLTNDGWYWGSSELDMHLACGVFRAVECRKPLLIAANTGFSAWIDADGRIRKQGPRRATDIIVAEPKLIHIDSWYLDHGDWFAGVCLVMCGIFGLFGLFGRGIGGEEPPLEQTGS